MTTLSVKIICVRFKSFKDKIKLVKRYEHKGYRVELLDDKFVYAERF